MEQFQEAEPGTATPNAENNGDNNGSETRIMEGIFSRAGVHSALEHDHIVNGKRVVRADPKIIEAEAKRVAAEAAEELRRASEAARSVPIGTPTWTGQSGIAGRPEEQPRSSVFGGSGSSSARRAAAGPSSASILANLSARTPSSSRSGSSSKTNSPAPTGARSEPGTGFTITTIRDYILAQGGAAFSQSLVNQFNRFCTTPQRTVHFTGTVRLSRSDSTKL